MTVLYRWSGHDVTDVGVQEFASVVPDVLKGPLTVHVEVWEKRPRHHFGTGGRDGILKESAPAYPSGRVFTGVEVGQDFADRCDGAVWEEGAVVALLFTKRFEVEGVSPRIRVTVKRSPVATIGDLVRREWEDPPIAALEHIAP